MILLGMENIDKRPLLHFATYIAGIDLKEIDSIFNNKLLKTKETFLESEIKPFIMKVIKMDKKSILYIPSSINSKYIFEIIHKLMDIKEISNNFNFFESNEEFELKEDEIIEKLEKNISICIDVNYGTEQYINLFTKYTTIVKNSTVVYLQNWNIDDMQTYFNISKKEIDNSLDEKLKSKIPDLLIDIYNYANQLYENYYIKSGIKLYLDVKNYNNVCEFYTSKYKEYKLILEEKQKKYNDGIKMADKIKEFLDKINKNLEDSIPKQEKYKRRLESKKEKKNSKIKEKNICRGNKQLEDKKTKELNDKKIQLELDLDEKLAPSREAIIKLNPSINKISQNDITEIRNTWESFNFGKFLISKLYHLFDKSYSDWDTTKRSLELETFRSLANINPKKIKDNLKTKLYDISKEVINNPEFMLNENKYQKPFKISGILCDFFSSWNKYFTQNELNKGLINKINDIKNELNSHEKRKKEIIEEGKIIDDEIIKIEQEIRELESRNDNLNGEKLKLTNLNKCFSEYHTLVNEKINIWKNKKSTIDIILYNYDFYLMIISCYLIYAAPLNKYFRKKLKNYLYSLSKELELENIKEFTLCGIVLEFLDNIDKDKDFCSAMSQYSEFLNDNFTMLYIMNNKIPYLIDSKRISFRIISKYLELNPQKKIVKANYNDINEIGDMFDKIELCMKNGSELFIDQCEENISDIFENYINEKSGYNAKTGKRSYLIKNKKLDKHENFKLYLINSKGSSKIPPKAFKDCYVINFNCPSDVICGIITDKLCTEQDPDTYQKINLNKKNIALNEFKLLELENKILNYNKQFDLSGNLDKLDFNKELLEKYKIEIQNYEQISNELEKNKKILVSDISDLFRYQTICTDTAQIFKWCSHLFSINNLYILPIDYLSDLAKEFYKKKFGIFAKLKGNIKTDLNIDFINENDSMNISGNEEEKSGEELSHEQGGTDNKVKAIENDIPSYTSDNSIEYIIFIYNKISPIYEPNKRKLLLLILLLNAINNREDNSTIFKQLLYASYRIYIKNQIDEDKYNLKSPINNISDRTWSALKQISDSCSNCFSLFLSDIENHRNEWDSYLESDDMLISLNFILTNENLESCFTPLTKFVFFSIIKPHLGYSLIDTLINDILTNEENFQKELNNSENTINLKIDKYKSLEDLFKENISINRKPILYFEVENGNLCLEKEIRDHYLKKMRNTNVENNNNIKQEGNAIEHTIHYKEINPNKLEISNSELEMIHNSMRIGGIILIRNPLLIEESLIKLIEEIQQKYTIINQNFKLILLVKKNLLLPKILYSSTDIYHNDFVLLKGIKEYIINLIKEKTIDLFNKFINCELHNLITFHMKKIYIYLLIINAILVQYSYIHSKIYKIPIDFCKKDFIISLKFIEQHISSINEEKIKALLDPDNNFGFNFDSIIKIILDTFINSRLIYREDEEKVHKMLSEFFEGDQFLKENNNYFNYNDFIIPIINEKLYPKKKEQGHENENQINFRHSNKNIPNIMFNYSIPKDALIKLFENIPDEKYYNLLFGVSNEMINNKSCQIIHEFYKIFSKDSPNESFILRNNNDINNIPEIFNVKSDKILQILDQIKNELPDQINTADANPILFKVNKFNELFNPLDECLQKEIESFNSFTNNILNDINNINLIMQGDMILNDKYYNILIDLNKNLIPNSWKKSKYLNCEVYIDKMLNILKYIYETINNWIINGTLLVYDLSALYSAKLFIVTLPIYFQRKLQEGNSVSSDKINIEYKLTKYEKIEEITDSVLEKIKKQNMNNNFILIKGLKIRNFESFYEKDSRIFQENLDKKEGEELPIILVTFSVNSFDNMERLKMNEEEEEDSEEDNINKKNLNTKKSVINIESSISKSEIKENIEEEYDQVQEMSEISTKKKSKYLQSKSAYFKEVSTKKTNVNVIQKYKYFTLKKYCKLNIPIIDFKEDEVYGIEEPLGYIELKFKCSNDKQEEYFINSNIQIDIDN